MSQPLRKWAVVSQVEKPCYKLFSVLTSTPTFLLTIKLSIIH